MLSAAEHLADHEGASVLVRLLHVLTSQPRCTRTASKFESAKDAIESFAKWADERGTPMSAVMRELIDKSYDEEVSADERSPEQNALAGGNPH